MSVADYNLGFVAFNNPEDVECMITSIQEWQLEGLKRCLVVDHSTDEVARNAIETVVKIAGWTYFSEENGGFGAGVNQLAAMSSDQDVLIVLNLDVRFCSLPPFAEMSRAIVQDSFSLVGTSLLNEEKQVVAGRLPPFSLKMLTFNFESANQGILKLQQACFGVQDWHGAVHGACFAIQIQDFISVGGLDENFFLYAEEFDLQTKLKKFSRRIGFIDSRSIVHHSEGKVSLKSAILNAFNLRYLAFRERRTTLFIYFTMQLIKLLFRIESRQPKPWAAVVRFNFNRKVLWQKLPTPF